MPSAVIAGILALICGSQFLDILPFSGNPHEIQNIVKYPSVLVVFFFATLFLGKRKNKISFNKILTDVGDTLFFNLASLVGQYGFALLFGLFILTPIFPDLHCAFALLLPAGFIGGHGTAAAIAGILEDNGFIGALSIGYTSATIGVLIGVLGGMFIINIGIRLGWSRIVKSMHKMPESIKTGFIPEKERIFVGKETVNPIALDSITWHFAIVLGIAVFAFYISDLLKNIFPNAYHIPGFCIALILGGIFQQIFNILQFGEYIDQHFINRIGSLITDYLIAFGIASITLNVIEKFIFPLILLFGFGTMVTICLMWFIGRKIYKNFWFERSLMMYGWNTGSIATSIVLLRVVDPNMRARIVEDFGIAYIGISFIELIIVAFLPTLVANNIILLPALILMILFVICILLSKFFVGWFPYSAQSIRNNELKIINKK